MTRKLLIFVLPMLLVSGCGDSQHKLHEIDKTITSWSASLKLAAENWSRAAVPRLHIEQTIDKADEQLAKTEKDLKHLKADELPKRFAAYRLHDLQNIVHQMRDALVARDRDKLQRLACSLDTTGGSP